MFSGPDGTQSNDGIGKRRASLNEGLEGAVRGEGELEAGDARLPKYLACGDEVLSGGRSQHGNHRTGWQRQRWVFGSGSHGRLLDQFG